MLINIPGIQAFKLPPDPDLALIQGKQSPFEIGKVFAALVLGKIGDNQINLQINNQQLTVTTDHHFMPGEELKVKVVDNNKQIILEVQSQQVSQAILNQALKKVLPQQASVAPVLNAAKEVSQSLSQSLSKLPETVQQQLKVIDSVIPTLTQLTQSKGLKQAIQNSGVFLEHKILNLDKLPITKDPNIQALPPSIIKDLKHQLLSFLQNINNQLSYLEQNGSKSEHPLLELKGHTTNQNYIASTPLTSMNENDVEIKPLELSAQLQRAAELIRTAITQNPNLNSDKSSKQSQQENIEPQAPHSAPQQNQSSNPTKVTATPYQESKPNGVHTEFLKHAALPLKGATPQPMKNDGALPQTNDQPKLLLEGLKEAVNCALSRMQANQLSNLMKDPYTMPTFLLDLPVNINEKQTEVLPFLIQQEHASTSEEPEGKTKHWSMMLALDMENLGALQIKVSLSFDKIYVTIWSDDPDTKRLLETKDQSLKTALLSEQLTIGNIDYRQGLKENNIDTSTINLLDEKI